MWARTVGVPGDGPEDNVSGIGIYLVELLRHGGFSELDPIIYTKGSNSALQLAETVGRILRSESTHWHQQAKARVERITLDETAKTINDAALEVFNE